MSRQKTTKRKVKQVGSASQMSLSIHVNSAAISSSGEPQGAEKKSGVMFKMVFNDPDPNKLFAGSVPLLDFLKETGFSYIFTVRELIRGLDLSPILSGYKSGGRRPYHPAGIIGLIVHGIMEGKTSLRELEALSRSDVRSWWLTGGVMPDYSVIGRFINRNSAFLTEAFFEQITSEILKKTQSKSSSAAVDGTVIQAAASRYHTIKREAAEEAAKVARKESQENPDDARLARKAEQAEQVEKEISSREKKQVKKKAVSVAPAEPEAVIQPLKTKAIAPAYKGSVAANDDRVITANAVHPSSETAVVPQLLVQTEHCGGEPVIEVLQDAGYHCNVLLKYARDNSINLLCPEGQTLSCDDWEKKSGKHFQKNQFVFDEQNDFYLCPAARELVRDHQYKGNENNPAYVEYRSKSCEGCEFKEKCTKSERRAIKRYAEDELREAMREKMRQPQARERYKKRQAMVEPVFAVLKYQQNLLRFRRRGLAAVKMEFSLHCAAYNMRRYLLLSGILAYGRQLTAFGAFLIAIFYMAVLYRCFKLPNLVGKTKIPQTIGRCPLFQRGI